MTLDISKICMKFGITDIKPFHEGFKSKVDYNREMDGINFEGN